MLEQDETLFRMSETPPSDGPPNDTPIAHAPGDQTLLAPNGEPVTVPQPRTEIEPATGPVYTGSDVAIAQRREQVLNLRKAGASMRAIAKKLGVSTVTVFRDLQHALDELNQSELTQAKQIRALEAARLDDMFLSIWPQAKQGAPHAVELALKLMERKSKLFGLDAAVKVDVMMQEERVQLLETLKAALPEDDFKRVLGILAVTATES